MKRILLYALMLLCVMTSCKRRPLTTADYTVIVNIEIEKEIVNYEVEKDPSLMRCVFYNADNGAFVTQAFLPPTGGQVSLVPMRSYDVLVYNFDTETTWIEDENWWDRIYASTSLIPDSFRTKLRSRAESKVDEENIPVVYTIELSSQKVANAIAETTGSKVARLHSCQNVTRQEFDAGETYLTLMQANVAALKEGLS